VAEQDLEWEPGKFSVKGAPDKFKTIQDIAFAAYTNHPQGLEAGLEAVSYYDPPNLTYPFGSYICVVDIDAGTGEVKVRRFVAIDDCGNIINPMIVQGQIHGGLTMGLAPALAADLQRRGEPFALATVVRCEPPTSAKPGAKALVRADGTVSGWVGGACAEPVVVREALAAIEDGRPRLIGLIGEGARGPGRTAGTVEYPMTCHS